MSVCIEVHLHAARLPDASGLASSISAMEPKFTFAGDYDFAADSGWCPCRLGDAECGFEWELATADELPPESAARRFDHVARLEYRSSDQDALCAVLVAAHVAALAGGVVTTPEGERIGPDDARAWASALVRKLAKGARGRAGKKKAAPQTPQQRVEAWLSGLAGVGVETLVRSLPDDPRISVRYGPALLLRARRWSVTNADGGVLSTERFPREMSRADIAALEAAFQRLVAVLRSGPVVSARFDADACGLEITHPDGVFRVMPRASGERSAYDQMFSHSDRWELQEDKTRVRPDAETLALTLS